MENKCVFCRIIGNEIPSNVLYEDEDFKVILDNGPATKGHAILLPKRHFSNLFEMDNHTATKLFPVVVKVAKAMKSALSCSGLNLLQNNGEVAGQTVFHFHLHLIPRYTEDDLNFSWDTVEYKEGEEANLANMVRNKLN